MRLRKLLALAAMLPFTAFGAGEDLCSDAAVQRAASDAECYSVETLYRVEGRVANATLATVTHASASRTYFLRTGEGELVALGALRALSYRPRERIVHELGFTTSTAGPASRMFDTVIEKAAGSYCVVYRMKPPYAGELRNCDGSGNPGGAIGFAPGITTGEGAYKAVCGLVSAESRKPCDAKGVQVMAPEIRYAPDGRMYYDVTTVERVGTFLNRNAQYEERTYRVDADGGKVSLLRKAAEACSGETCTPLPGGIVR